MDNYTINNENSSQTNNNTISALFCQEECFSNNDCLEDWTCNDNRCVYTSYNANCTENDECLPLLSGWTKTCNRQEDCDGYAAGTQMCISYKNQGLCAYIPGEYLTCEDLQQDQISMQAMGTGQNITVCAQTRAKCIDSYCQLSCNDDSHCTGSDYHKCNQSNGKCTCTQGSCIYNSSICSADGICRCQSNSDCTEGNVDTCYNGFCGCSDKYICPEETSHPGTTWVCEPFSFPF